MTSHRPAHAALTEKQTRTRWDETRWRVEVEDYRFRVELEPLPWAPSYPRG